MEVLTNFRSSLKADIRRSKVMEYWTRDSSALRQKRPLAKVGFCPRADIQSERLYSIPINTRDVETQASVILFV
jgi:hypothetical protein